MSALPTINPEAVVGTASEHVAIRRLLWLIDNEPPPEATSRTSWAKNWSAAVAQARAATAHREALGKLVREQAEDPALHVEADSIVEAYALQEWRRLHDAARATFIAE